MAWFRFSTSAANARHGANRRTARQDAPPNRQGDGSSGYRFMGRGGDAFVVGARQASGPRSAVKSSSCAVGRSKLAIATELPRAQHQAMRPESHGRRVGEARIVADRESVHADCLEAEMIESRNGSQIPCFSVGSGRIARCHQGVRSFRTCSGRSTPSYRRDSRRASARSRSPGDTRMHPTHTALSENNWAQCVELLNKHLAAAIRCKPARHRVARSRGECRRRRAILRRGDPPVSRGGRRDLSATPGNPRMSAR